VQGRFDVAYATSAITTFDMLPGEVHFIGNQEDFILSVDVPKCETYYKMSFPNSEGMSIRRLACASLDHAPKLVIINRHSCYVEQNIGIKAPDDYGNVKL
jgi:hypothetical protein